MSNPSPVQARVPSGSEQGAAIRQSASFSAHLKGLERTIPLRSRYENFVGGKWLAPVKGGYFDNVSPTTGPGDLPDCHARRRKTLSARSMLHMLRLTVGRRTAGGRARTRAESHRGPDGAVPALPGRG